MDVFQAHQQLLADYEAFTAGFTKIHDPRIREHLDRRVANGDQWPDTYLSLNPNFASGGSISELVKQGFLHPECERIFRVGKEEHPGAQRQVIDLHQHQREAVEIARGGASYVLTTGTGSAAQRLDHLPRAGAVVHHTRHGLAAFAEDHGDGGPPFRWDEERRFWLCAELDAAYFHLYGVPREDVDYVMDTFRAFRNNDPDRFTRTKKAILEIYDAMTSAIRTGDPYRTVLNPPPGHGPRHQPR